MMIALCLGTLHSACGYTLQNSKNPALTKEGIHKIYVEPLVNNTYKAGVENTVYNALVKKISSHEHVKLVRSAEDADAVIKGTVASAEYTSSALTTASQLAPIGTGPSNILVASQYNALLTCTFDLYRAKKDGTHGDYLWGSQFSRTKFFPANTQLGTLGTTSALINDSEFDRTLSDLAESMMSDVHESMLGLF